MAGIPIQAQEGTFDENIENSTKDIERSRFMGLWVSLKQPKYIILYKELKLWDFFQTN